MILEEGLLTSLLSYIINEDKAIFEDPKPTDPSGHFQATRTIVLMRSYLNSRLHCVEIEY